MGFIEEVLSRRAAFHEKLEGKAAKGMQTELKRILDEARLSVKDLEKRFAEDGKFTKGPEVVAAARRKVAEIEKTIEEMCGKAAKKLIGARETAYRLGVADMQYALDVSAAQMNIELKASFDLVFKQAAKKAAGSPVLGVKPSKALNGVSKWMQKKISSNITNAVLNGEDIESTARKLTKIEGITTRAATRITRTNLNAAMNEAHTDAIKENPQIFAGYRWDATFDERTSTICAALHGRVFALDETPPGPPAHPNCRSTLVAVFADPDVEEFMNGGSRRVRNINEDGSRGKTTVVDNTANFEDWLVKQKPTASAKITGSPIKDKLWRDGKIAFDELLAPDLSIRSDADLVQRALSKRPKDKELKELAKSLNVKAVKPESLRKRDSALAKEAAFDIGQRR